MDNTVAIKADPASHPLPAAVAMDSENTPLLKVVGDANKQPSLNDSPYLDGITPTRFWTILPIITVALGIGCFDTTVMASTHPVITSYFHSSNSASWLSTAFMLTSTATQPLLGRLSDTLGRKPPYLCALLIFMAATLWCALAQSMISFIWARAVCGIGAGIVMSMGNIIISDMVRIECRGPYQSMMNLNWGFWSVIGAASGGAITQLVGWRWMFGIQLPGLAVIFVLAALVIPKDIGKAKTDSKEKTLLESMRGFDYIGSSLLITLLSCMILGLNLGGNILPWSHPIVIISLGTFVLLIPVFLHNEKQHPTPILPLELCFKSPHLNIMMANFLLPVLLNAIVFNVPLFFRAVLFESPAKTGLRLMIIFASQCITGTPTGFLISWTRRLKWPLISGTVLVLLGTVTVTLWLEPNRSPALYALALLPQSLGQGFFFPGSVMAILGVSTQQQQAIVTSIMNTWRNVGVVIGVAYSSLMLQNLLVYYLNDLVTGPQKAEVINRVRESVDAILQLEQPYQDQVVRAYATSLKLTFMSSIVVAALAIVVLAPLKLPHLNKRGQTK